MDLACILLFLIIVLIILILHIFRTHFHLLAPFSSYPSPSSITCSLSWTWTLLISYFSLLLFLLSWFSTYFELISIYLFFSSYPSPSISCSLSWTWTLLVSYFSSLLFLLSWFSTYFELIFIYLLFSPLSLLPLLSPVRWPHSLAFLPPHISSITCSSLLLIQEYDLLWLQ
jgi:hypothetical protein